MHHGGLVRDQERDRVRDVGRTHHPAGPGARGHPALLTTDPDVARWWGDHAVRDHASVAKRINHPPAGRLVFDIEVVVTPQDPDQRLVVYTAGPDSATARRLPLPAGWGAEVPAGGRR